MHRKSASLFEKTSETVFHGLSTWENLVQAFKDIRLEDEEWIQVATVGSKEHLSKVLESRKLLKGLRLIDSTNELSHFEYTRRYGRDSQRRVTGSFVVAHPTHDPIYILLFVSAPRFWTEGISPLLDSLYPTAAHPFLTQKELHDLLGNVQRAIQPQRLRVLELTSKQRLTLKARKRFQSVREWTDREFDAVFAEARENNIWFSSVSFDLATEENGHIASAGINGKLSKYGYFRCDHNFPLFERTIIRDLVRISSQRLKFFSNRDRLSTRNHEPSPVQIEYDVDIFKTSEQARRLVEAMRRFKHGTCTVLHANPYIHLSLVDNIDFSAADLWVLSKNEILLVPEIKASDVALRRIVNHIFENFREGKISDFQER
jgi:hypothetical protein